MTPAPNDHFNGKTFFNPEHVDRSWRDVLRWRRTSRPAAWPESVALAPQPPPPAPSADAFVVTWIGHATFLVQTTRGNFLTDPQFAERCGPFGRFGPKRVHPPGVALDALPRIDVVLLSHDHYDHCDLASLRALRRAHDPLAITPLANGPLLRRAGFARDRIVELDWWETRPNVARGLDVTVTPSLHWSNRLSGPRNGRLWGGFMVEFSSLESRFSIGRHSRSAPPHPEIKNRDSKIENSDAAPRRFWFAGDTGYDATLFPEIRRRLGPPDVAAIPIGAYEPRWFMAPQHCNPAEAVAIHREVGAGVSLAMHWGTWQLTDEARDEPPRALAAARTAAGLAAEAFRVMAPGESLTL